MELLLFLIGALSTILFIVNNIARTVMRQRDLKLVEITLGFFVVLMPAAALIVDNQNSASFDTLEQLIFLLVIPLAILHVGLTIVEAFRPQRLRQSRGLFGLGLAILLVIAAFSYNFVALNAELSNLERNVRPTPVNASTDRDLCDIAQEAFSRELVVLLLEQSGVSLDDIVEGLNESIDTSVADLIRQQGNNPTRVINATVEFIEDNATNLLARGCITQANATQFISLSRPVVGTLINSNPEQLITSARRFGFIENDVDAEEAVSFSLTAVAENRATIDAFLTQEPSPLPTITPTVTPSNTPTPTVTRTPRPTLSPTPTRERFMTPTPSATATLPNPCLATANFNVNMRTYPDLEESEVLLVIPFEAVFTVYAPNPEGDWWYSQYEGEVGWVSDEFIRVTRNCNDLPPRNPDRR